MFNAGYASIPAEDYYTHLQQVNFVGATGNVTMNSATARRNGY